MNWVSIGIAVVGVWFVLSGVWKMITRRGTSYHWRYEPPGWAVRDDIQQSGCRAFFGGAFRIVLGVLIIAGAMALDSWLEDEANATGPRSTATVLVVDDAPGASSRITTG